MPYVWHTAWPPGAADGCLFGLFHREQVEDATSMYLRIGPGRPAVSPVSAAFCSSLTSVSSRNFGPVTRVLG